MPQITGNEPATGYGFGWDSKEGSCCEYSGLTIRQEFASRAMQSLIISTTPNLVAPKIEETVVDILLAKRAVQIADALIEALNK